jgi:serine/threonine protein kinase
LSEVELQVISREIRVHSSLDHPHIVKLWDTLYQDNKVYMVMDFAKNGSLFKYHSGLLQTGRQPSVGQVYQFFYQALQALKYLHANDIMHRDIKVITMLFQPENLLLDDEFNVKLCDFGWATNRIKCARNTFCGTYEYMAPEMVLESSYDYRIDIWALGVLLYELVHGKAPFPA